MRASSKRSIRFQRDLIHSKAGVGYWLDCMARVASFGVLDVVHTLGSKDARSKLGFGVV